MNQDAIKPPYYIELLTRDKNLKARHRFEKLPIRIGRSYDNDLILDDPYVAANHALIEISEDGNLQICDLNSENGLVVNGKKQSQITLDNHVARLGHTNLRVRHAGSKVAKALVDKAAHRWEGWPPAITGLLLVFFSVLGSTWLNASESFSMISAIAVISLIVFLILLWCGGWAFATRMISGGSTRFGRHIFIVGCAIILIDLWNIASITLAYAFSLPFLTHYGSSMEVIIFAGMIFFHLMMINSQRAKRFINTSIIIAILGISSIFISNYQRSGILADSLYMTYLLPPPLRISGDMPVGQFITEANRLRPELEEARKKPANARRGLFGQ
ncbi:MAG TPA: FHA domain-containing protein [Methylophilaceae bacterium]|nr:FHA domain-containing protein [Methylophilaceae bacterium]